MNSRSVCIWRKLGESLLTTFMCLVFPMLWYYLYTNSVPEISGTQVITGHVYSTGYTKPSPSLRTAHVEFGYIDVQIDDEVLRVWLYESVWYCLDLLQANDLVEVRFYGDNARMLCGLSNNNIELLNYDEYVELTRPGIFMGWLFPALAILSLLWLPFCIFGVWFEFQPKPSLVGNGTESDPV